MQFMRKSFSLRSAVIVVVLIPLLTVFGLGGLFVLATLERQLETRLQDDIAVIARTLRVPLARSLERRRSYSLDRALRSASQFGRVYGVYVYDRDGRPIAGADQENGDRSAILPQLDGETLAQLDVEQEQTTAEYGSMRGREVYSYFTPLTDAAGNAIGMLQVTRRASDIRDYLEALRANVARLMLAFGAFFIAIVIAGHYLVFGRPIQHLADAMSRVAHGDTQVRAAGRGPREIRWLAGRFNAMLDAIVHRDNVLSRERERQRRLEHNLRQSEKYALVGRLAAGVAHELGTPLSVIDGHAQRLMRDAEPDSRTHRSLARVRESTDRMAAIVRDLLGFGHASTDAAHEVPVRRLVSLAASDVRAQRFDEGIELEVIEGPPEAHVFVDEGRMREALVHLLRNAAQAPDGGRVRVGWSETPRGTRLFVEDSGSGIAPGDRDRIFEPFFTTKQPGVGSGLGLAIVKGTVADQGAEIRIYDAALGGAGFEIEIPRERSLGS